MDGNYIDDWYYLGIHDETIIDTENSNERREVEITTLLLKIVGIILVIVGTALCTSGYFYNELTGTNDCTGIIILIIIGIIIVLTDGKLFFEPYCEDEDEVI